MSWSSLERVMHPSLVSERQHMSGSQSTIREAVGGESLRTAIEET